MNLKFLLPKARGFVEKGKIPKRASQRFRGLVPLQHMLPTDGYIDRVVLLDTNFNFITLLGSYSSTTDLVNGAAWTYAPGSYYVELKKK